MAASERTHVIVVGAGASQEFDLPTGAELTSIIQRDLSFKIDDFGNMTTGNGDTELKHSVEILARETGVSLRIFASLAMQISQNMALAPSIDNYLDTHKENQNLVRLGKLAIANAILKAEQQSSLKIDQSNINNKLDSSKTIYTWAAVFFKIIVAKRNYANFLAAIENITFVSFNYDRCIKQFFVNAAASYFELNDKQIEEVLTKLEVIHPYGSIGELHVSNGRVEGFAPEATGSTIYSASKLIRTFTEGVSDADLLENIKGPLRNAELVIFLGFSFIDINMQILEPERARAKRVLATAKGRSEDTRTALKKEIELKFTRYNMPEPRAGKSVEMFEGKCFELFYEFDHYLATAQSA